MPFTPLRSREPRPWLQVLQLENHVINYHSHLLSYAPRQPYFSPSINPSAPCCSFRTPAGRPISYSRAQKLIVYISFPTLFFIQPPSNHHSKSSFPADFTTTSQYILLQRQHYITGRLRMKWIFCTISTMKTNLFRQQWDRRITFFWRKGKSIYYQSREKRFQLLT